MPHLEDKAVKGWAVMANKIEVGSILDVKVSNDENKIRYEYKNNNSPSLGSRATAAVKYGILTWWKRWLGSAVRAGAKGKKITRDKERTPSH